MQASTFYFPSVTIEKIEKGISTAFWKLFHSVFRKYNRSHYLLLPRQGIRNYGNTCFLNSVLQAFASTPSLRAYLGAIEDTSPSLLKFNKNLKICMEALRDPSSSSKIDKSAKTIYDQLSKHRKMFGDKTEQDAEECLQALLSMMSIELKEAKKMKDRKSLIIEKSSMPLNLPFEGWCSSTITCLKCRHSKPKKHQTFVDISLSLQNISRSRSQLDLLECLDHYSFQESLSDVECLHCSYNEILSDRETLQDIFQRCGSKEIGELIEKYDFLKGNSHQLDKIADEITEVARVRTDACKQLKISRLPEVLCLHLSRRLYNPTTGCMLKNRFKITFPTRLDMKQYMESSVSSSESASSLILGSNHSQSNTEYNLRAVIVHHGDANTGHYTTYALLDAPGPTLSSSAESSYSEISTRNKRWMHFSDEKAVPVSQDEVLASEAYMLFYDKASNSP